jgi:hypothetical protein
LRHHAGIPIRAAATGMTVTLALGLSALACLLLGLWLLALGRRRHRQQRISFVLHAGNGVLLMLLAALLAALALAVQPFRLWLEEETVATLAVHQRGAQQYQVELVDAGGRRRAFALQGDDWQLDVRLLRWRLPALLAGAPNLYQLDRLSGRYRDLQQEREAPRSVHALAEPGLIDLWTLRRQFPRWLGFVDAEFGSGVYLPLVDGARYEISLGNRGGLVARPADAATAEMLQGD